jgi:hypothetical protein
MVHSLSVVYLSVRIGPRVARKTLLPARTPHVAAGICHVAAGSWILSNTVDVSSQIGQCRNRRKALVSGGNGRKRHSRRHPHTVSLPPNRTFASFTSILPSPSYGPKATEATIMPLFREATIMRKRTMEIYLVRGPRASCIYLLTSLEGSLRGQGGMLECWLSGVPIMRVHPLRGRQIRCAKTLDTPSCGGYDCSATQRRRD